MVSCGLQRLSELALQRASVDEADLWRVAVGILSLEGSAVKPTHVPSNSAYLRGPPNERSIPTLSTKTLSAPNRKRQAVLSYRAATALQVLQPGGGSQVYSHEARTQASPARIILYCRTRGLLQDPSTPKGCSQQT